MIYNDVNLEEMKSQLMEKGFLDVPVDPTLDLFEEIEKLKKEKNAILLAHYYVDGDIQDVADYVGDSLGLSQQAAATDADMIVFVGVHFMAETAKILNPGKKVILPDLNAGCSLSDSCPADKFKVFKEQHPDHVVISYINCSAGLKALSDVIVTSTNAETVVSTFPDDQPIIFAPDKNLGAYINKKSGRDMLLWDGACMVHEIFSRKRIVELMTEHPDARVIAHPECEAHILELAHHIGSTSSLLKYSKESEYDKFIVVTESGILHEMQKQSPNKIFIAAPSTDETCACNDCPHMKLNTMEKLYNAMKYEEPEIIVEESLRLKALKPIERMLEISKQHGL